MVYTSRIFYLDSFRECERIVLLIAFGFCREWAYGSQEQNRQNKNNMQFSANTFGCINSFRDIGTKIDIYLNLFRVGV